MSKDFIEDLVGTKWLCIDDESEMFGEVHEVIYGFVDLSYNGDNEVVIDQNGVEFGMKYRRLCMRYERLD